MGRKPALLAWWSKRQRDLVYEWAGDSSDRWLLHNLLMYGMGFTVRKHGGDADVVPAFRAELERRGYDPDSFRVSVRRKEVAT